MRHRRAITYIGMFVAVVSFPVLCPGMIGAQGPTVLSQYPVSQSESQTRKKVSSRDPMDSRVRLSVKDSTVASALRAIARTAGLKIFFDATDPKFSRKVSVSNVDTSMSVALSQILAGTGLKTKIADDGETLMIRYQDSVTSKQVQPQGVMVKGSIFDSATKKGLQGVTVSLQGTNKTAVTNDEGHYSFKNVPDGQYVLHAKVFGYQAVSRSVTISGKLPLTHNITLTRTATMLSGIVTTATGVQRKVEVGNDIVSINVDSVMKLAPVSSLSDLLANRVPGMIVQKTSGAPGAPSKIRIRGLSSMNSTNDPIVIMDGIRMYAAQGSNGVGVALNILNSADQAGSVDRSENMVARTQNNQLGGELTSSPLDQIDPNIIESIEVLKGPSAVALYGTDAANGVIVITTKKGQTGSAKWSANVIYGTEYMPGKWPTNYWRWGTELSRGGNLGTASRHCPMSLELGGYCRPDSIEKYQILNDPNTTVFGKGNNSTYRGDVRGGTRGLAYVFTGAISNTLGLIKLPDMDVKLLKENNEKVTGWAKRPQARQQQSGSVRIDAEVRPDFLIAFTHTLNREYSRTSPLSTAINQASSLPPRGQSFSVPNGGFIESDTAVGTGLLQVIPDYSKRISSQTIRSTNALTIDTDRFSWMKLNATGGIDISTRKDLSMIGRDDCRTCTDIYGAKVSLGEHNAGNGSARSSSLRLRMSSNTYRLRNLMSIRASVGGDYVNTNTYDLSRMASDITAGATSGNGAGTISTNERIDDRSTAGTYTEMLIGIADRFYVPLAIRSDVGSALGANVNPKFPKLAFSYVISDQPLFRKVPLTGSISTLRLRTAYGQAGVQPTIAAKLRLYRDHVATADGESSPLFTVLSVGNPAVKPERTHEFEGGLDVGFVEDRLNLRVTAYSKITNDALVSMKLPNSLGMLRQYDAQMNLGKVKNTGLEMSLDSRILDSETASWTINANYASNKNKLVHLGRSPIVTFSGNNGFNASSQSFVEGYPLYGRWARPVIGYQDLDNNGVISRGEVVLGDSSVFLGGTYPKFDASLHNTITLFSSLTVSGSFSYQHELTQANSNLTNTTFLQTNNDPSTSLDAQAYMVVQTGPTGSEIGIIQTVSVLRFNSFSLNYLIPRSLVNRVLNNRQINVAVQGNNLGMKSNYRGKDPNVNSSMGEIMGDNGALPVPRTWQLSFRIN